MAVTNGDGPVTLQGADLKRMNAVQGGSHQSSTASAGNAGAEGLTSEEARHRLNKFGPNAVPDTSVHPLQMILEKFWAPVPWMLEARNPADKGLSCGRQAGQSKMACAGNRVKLPLIEVTPEVPQSKPEAWRLFAVMLPWPVSMTRRAKSPQASFRQSNGSFSLFRASGGLV